MLKIPLFLFAILGTLLAKSQPADLILFNAKVFTSDTARLFAEAIAIRGDKILAVGTNESIQKLAGKATRRMDLMGKTVIPGINDAHDHIGYGAPAGPYFQFEGDMYKGPSLNQVLDTLAKMVKAVPEGTLLQGQIGLEVLEDPKARRQALDQVAPNHPVIIKVPWGHGTIINTKAMQVYGISETERDLLAGFYERMDGSDKITGRLSEYAETKLQRKWYTSLPENMLLAVLRQYSDEAVRFGITSVQNMATAMELDKMVGLLNKAQLPLRIRSIRFPGTNQNSRLYHDIIKKYPSTPKLSVQGVKWILDATPLERGALMEAAYTDKPGWVGKLNFPMDTMRTILREGLLSKEQLLLHVAGDSTDNIVLAEMGKLANNQTWRNKRVRFEHGDGLLANNWSKARDLGIVVVQNPIHFAFPEIHHSRLGAERAGLYQPLRSLIRSGISVAIGSDGPINPYLNIMFATVHPNNPKEAITREEAVIAYTRGSAYAEFKEKEKGMLKPGLLADLAVLSQDVFTVPVPELPKTVSVLTLIGGKVVYDAASSAAKGVSTNGK